MSDESWKFFGHTVFLTQCSILICWMHISGKWMAHSEKMIFAFHLPDGQVDWILKFWVCQYFQVIKKKKNFMVHQTLGPAIRNVQHVWWFLWTFIVIDSVYRRSSRSSTTMCHVSWLCHRTCGKVTGKCWLTSVRSHQMRPLTHWGRDKMAAILPTKFWRAFSWMKIYKFWLRFHWHLFFRFQLTIAQHLCR